jgi:hypothetical protein
LNLVNETTESGEPTDSGRPSPHVPVTDAMADEPTLALAPQGSTRETRIRWAPVLGRSRLASSTMTDRLQPRLFGFMRSVGTLPRGSLFLGSGIFLAILLGYARMGSWMWPRFTIESMPSAAFVVVDGRRLLGQTPVTVRLEPGRPHTLDFRLAGHRSAIQTVSSATDRGEHRALLVELVRLPPQVTIPVKARVFVNEILAGEGQLVALEQLPVSGPVVLRVEAEGYAVFQHTFASSNSIPNAFDVSLSERR